MNIIEVLASAMAWVGSAIIWKDEFWLEALLRLTTTLMVDVSGILGRNSTLHSRDLLDVMIASTSSAQQLENNSEELVTASLSIPIFGKFVLEYQPSNAEQRVG